MEQANKHGERMVITLIKIFPVSCSISLLVICIGSVIYSKLVNDHIHLNDLYRVYKIMYEIQKKIYLKFNPNVLFLDYLGTKTLYGVG